MDYNQALSYIFKPDFMGARERTLNRMRELMRLLGSPQDCLKFVHVAGTNGKGSTSIMVASILSAAGYKTGMFTSPSLITYNERIKIGSQDISDKDFALYISKVAQKVEVLVELETPPSFFEILTACAFLYFKDSGCDFVVLEVGLGGEFDATNVINPPEVTVITPISFDHTQILGGSLYNIATAKAAIIKSHAPVIYANNNDIASEVIKQRAKQQGCEAVHPLKSELEIINTNIGGQIFSYGDFKNLRINIIGLHQIDNALLALMAVLSLRKSGYNIADKAITDGLEAAKWPGRMEVLCQKPVVILDGAHNPHGAAALAKSLAYYFGGKKISFIVGILEDKGYREMLAHIIPLAKDFITVAPQSSRAIPAEKLMQEIQKLNPDMQVAFCPDIGSAIKKMFNKTQETDVVCIFGSLYFVGDVKEFIGGNRGKYEK